MKEEFRNDGSFVEVIYFLKFSFLHSFYYFPLTFIQSNIFFLVMLYSILNLFKDVFVDRFSCLQILLIILLIYINLIFSFLLNYCRYSKISCVCKSVIKGNLRTSAYVFYFSRCPVCG